MCLNAPSCLVKTPHSSRLILGDLANALQTATEFFPDCNIHFMTSLCFQIKNLFGALKRFPELHIYRIAEEILPKGWGEGLCTF